MEIAQHLWDFIFFFFLVLIFPLISDSGQSLLTFDPLNVALKDKTYLL